MRALAITLATPILLSAAVPAAAQYFGRNKVQVESFEFRILPTAHFDIHYYPAEHDAALDAARMAERWSNARRSFSTRATRISGRPRSSTACCRTASADSPIIIAAASCCRLPAG
jgi:hypothetical protein